METRCHARSGFYRVSSSGTNIRTIISNRMQCIIVNDQMIFEIRLECTSDFSKL